MPRPLFPPQHYAANDLKLKRFVPLIPSSPVYPVVRDSAGVVASLPPVINGAASAVSLATTDLFIECTGTDLRKCRTVLATVVAMFSEYAAVPFQAEPVDVVDALGETHSELPFFFFRLEREGMGALLLLTHTLLTQTHPPPSPPR